MPAPAAIEELDEFGQLVRRAREALELSQIELAERMGIKQAHMSGIERGVVVDVGAGLLGKLEQQLGIPLEILTRAAISRAKKHGASPSAEGPNGPDDTAENNIVEDDEKASLEADGISTVDRGPPSSLTEDETPTGWAP